MYSRPVAKTDPLDLIPVSTLGLPVQVRNSLIASNVRTVADLHKVGAGRLGMIKRIGPRSRTKIRVRLLEMGVPFPEDPKKMDDLRSRLAAEKLRASFRNLLRGDWFSKAIAGGMKADDLVGILREEIDEAIAGGVMDA